MSVQAGNAVQEAVGRKLAQVRVDNLGLRNMDLSEALTAHAEQKVTASRISEAEHGKDNLNKEYVALFLQYVKDTSPDVFAMLESDVDFQHDVEMLPSHLMKHHSNEGHEGNTSTAPRTPPIASMLAKRKARKAGAQASDAISIMLTDKGELLIESRDFSCRLTSFEGELRIR